MIAITATALLDAIRCAAISEGLYCRHSGKWYGMEFENLTRAVDVVLDDLACRAGLLETPADVHSVEVSLLSGEGSNWGASEFDTADIRHWGEGVIYSWGELHKAVQDATWCTPCSHVLQYVLRVGLEYGADDSIELDIIAEWDDESAGWVLDDAILVSSVDLG